MISFFKQIPGALILTGKKIVVAKSGEGRLDLLELCESPHFPFPPLPHRHPARARYQEVSDATARNPGAEAHKNKDGGHFVKCRATIYCL